MTTGRFSTAAGRLITTGAGLMTIGAPAFTTKLCGFRSTTIDGCEWMKIFGFGVVGGSCTGPGPNGSGG